MYMYYYYNNHFTTLCPGLPRWVGTRRINHSGFCWSRHDGVAVASAEPYASYLHIAPQDNHASTSSVRFLQDRCPSWHPTNSVKALKATIAHVMKRKFNEMYNSATWLTTHLPLLYIFTKLMWTLTIGCIMTTAQQILFHVSVQLRTTHYTVPYICLLYTSDAADE